MSDPQLDTTHQGLLELAEQAAYFYAALKDQGLADVLAYDLVGRWLDASIVVDE